MALRGVKEENGRGAQRFERFDQQHASLVAERTAVFLRSAVYWGCFVSGLSDGDQSSAHEWSVLASTFGRSPRTVAELAS